MKNRFVAAGDRSNVHQRVGTFAGMEIGWGLSGTLDLDAAANAFLGLAVLMLAGIFTPDDIKS